MDFRAYHYYEAVAKAGGVRPAAEQLFVSPSAISRQIQRLEEELGVELLERNIRGAVPTPAGRILLKHISNLRSEDESLHAHLDQFKKIEAGEIRIALGGGYSGDLVSSALKSFCQDYPGITFNLSIDGTSGIIRKVHNNEADIGLVFDPPYDPHIESLNICCQPLYLVSRTDNRRFSRDYPVTLTDLADERFIMFNRNFGVRQVIERCLSELNMTLPVHMECDSFDMAKQYVSQGLGLSLLPKFCISDEIRKGRLQATPLTHELLNNQNSHIIIRRDRTLPRLLTVFSEYLIRDLASCH